MISALFICSVGWAGDDPRHIVVPDPLEETQPGAPAAPASTAPVATASPMPAAVRRPANRAQLRKVEGAAPSNVYGRYSVVDVTEGDETEPFVLKMERAGRALDEDCIAVKLTFDFGPAPAEDATGHRPSSIEVQQVRNCDKGGLGRYADEISYEVPVQWTEGEEALTLIVPNVTVLSDYVRLRRPTDGDMRTPSQWLAPENRVEREETTYLLVAEEPKRKAMPVFHLKSDGQIMHLEAESMDEPAAP